MDDITPDVVGKVTVVTSDATAGSVTFRNVPSSAELPQGKALGKQRGGNGGHHPEDDPILVSI